MVIRRFSDKVATVKSKALKVMHRYLVKRPGEIHDIDLLFHILEQNVARLRDSSAIVRKNALKLFNKLVLEFGERIDLNSKGGRFMPFEELL